MHLSLQEVDGSVRTHGFLETDMVVILVHGISHIRHIVDMFNKKRK